MKTLLLLTMISFYISFIRFSTQIKTSTKFTYNFLDNFLSPSKISTTQDGNFNDRITENDQNSRLLCSINFIAHPHHFPDYGLDVNNEDPFGNRLISNFDNRTSDFIPGELSKIGRMQIVEIAKKINLEMKQNGNLKKQEILTIAIRLRRSIESAKILNEELMNLNNITYEHNFIKKLDVNYFNTSLVELGMSNLTSVQDKIYEFVLNHQKFSNGKKKHSNQFKGNDIATFFIPTEYEKIILPLNFKLNKCDKIKQNFESNISNKEVRSFISSNFKQIINGFSKILKSKIFKLIITKNFERYLNFSDYNLNNSIESTKILADYFFNYRLLSSSQIFTKPSNLDLDRYTTDFFFGKFNLFDLKTYYVFFIQNFSNDIIKIYSSGLFKLLSQLIYSKLDGLANDLNSKLKLVNIMMHEYNLAGIYKVLNSNLFNNKEEDMIDLEKFPKINYGSRLNIAIYIPQKKTENENDQNLNLEIMEVRISFENKLLQTIKLTDFAEKINNFIENDDSFFNNICNNE